MAPGETGSPESWSRALDRSSGMPQLGRAAEKGAGLGMPK
jgi:hypothetical protein